MTEFDKQLAMLVSCLQPTKNIIAAMQAMQLSDTQRDSVHVALCKHLPVGVNNRGDENDPTVRDDYLTSIMTRIEEVPTIDFKRR